MIVLLQIVGVRIISLISIIFDIKASGPVAMNRKPDIIRAIVLIFAIGLVITGFTSMKSPESGFSAAASAFVSEAPSSDESRRN